MNGWAGKEKIAKNDNTKIQQGGFYHGSDKGINGRACGGARQTGGRREDRGRAVCALPHRHGEPEHRSRRPCGHTADLGLRRKEKENNEDKRNTRLVSF